MKRGIFAIVLLAGCGGDGAVCPDRFASVTERVPDCDPCESGTALVVTGRFDEMLASPEECRATAELHCVGEVDQEIALTLDETGHRWIAAATLQCDADAPVKCGVRFDWHPSSGGIHSEGTGDFGCVTP